MKKTLTYSMGGHTIAFIAGLYATTEYLAGPVGLSMLAGDITVYLIEEKRLRDKVIAERRMSKESLEWLYGNSNKLRRLYSQKTYKFEARHKSNVEGY